MELRRIADLAFGVSLGWPARGTLSGHLHPTPSLSQQTLGLCSSVWDPGCQSWIRLLSGNLPEPWTAGLPHHTMFSILWGAAQAAPLAGHELKHREEFTVSSAWAGNQPRPLQGGRMHSKAKPELSSVCRIKSDLGKRRLPVEARTEVSPYRWRREGSFLVTRRTQ